MAAAALYCMHDSNLHTICCNGTANHVPPLAQQCCIADIQRRRCTLRLHLHAVASLFNSVVKKLDVLSVMQDLQVQCEAQVLLFVLDYVDSTQLEPAVAAQLFQHVSLLMLVAEIYC